ncbi:MAG: hypothetical protein A2X94_12565 [Bdellovibrionales bacterium GWB1_55_8]|nr:MAG: hypothetical protein A2X94_12565 [Bdellovibrionales bacterium GWB1_55_8]
MEQRVHSLLVVDDEIVLRNAIAFDFKRKGYVVTTAGDGKEALGYLESKRFDLILTDVRMPGMDGVELLKQLRHQNSKVPVVIFITGFADISTEEAYELGAHAVFSKPFDRKALLSAVEKALEGIDAVWRVRPERVRFEMDVELVFPDADTAIRSRLVNIGTGGFFVTLPPERMAAVGSAISFRLNFEATSMGPVLIQGSGIVRWVRPQLLDGRPAGCGVEFISLAESDRNLVSALLKSIATGSAFIPRG